MATACVSAEGPGLDRVAAIAGEGWASAALADGAGGVGGSGPVADAIVDALADLAWARSDEGEAAADVIESIDRRAAGRGGESTAVLVAVRGGRVFGASVGDSRAWWLARGGAVVDLTAGQRRVPRVGTGRARPVSFSASVGEGRLLVVSDGVHSYVKLARLLEVAREGDVQEAARRLIDVARLPGGGLQDDASVALVDVGG